MLYKSLYLPKDSEVSATLGTELLDPRLAGLIDIATQ